MIAKGNVAVTGASSGIGEQLARALAPRSRKLFLLARRTDRLNALAEELAGTCEPVPVHLDLLSRESISKAAQSLSAQIPSLDLLVHCAGISQRSLARNTPYDDVRKLMQINFLGTVELNSLLLSLSLESVWKQVVVVSSVVGLFESPHRSVYCASKHALHGYFESLRAEEFHNGLRVLMACPGFVATALPSQAIGAEEFLRENPTNQNQNGIEAERCAKQIVEALDAQKLAVYPGGKETLAVHVKRLFPALFARLIRKAKVV